jgi:adenine-specific DNA-methyltransferase
VIVRNVAARIRGYELDGFAAWISQVFLDAALFTHLGGSSLEQFEAVDVCDSLTRTDGASFDVVIGNPPYGRVALSESQRELFQRSLYGHANQYGVFLDLAVRRVRNPGGIIGYVTPTSFLSGQYFKNLRSMLASEAPPVSVDFVAERDGVFDDVLQETLLAVCKRQRTEARPSIHFVEARGNQLKVVSGGHAAIPMDATAPWILPRAREHVALTRAMQRMPSRLADWGYRVSTGPLVWNRHKTQLRWSPSSASVPLVWAESVTADGEFVFRATRRNHAPYFAPKVGDDWLLVSSPCVLLQRTTSKEQARRLIAAEMPPSFVAKHGSVTVENHLNMIVPTSSAPKVDTATLAAFLNSRAADQVFRCISGSVAVSAYELESMPLPAASDLGKLASSVARGASRDAIDRCCDSLYGE